jgi:low affinity Fe/Cu permease
MGYVRANLMACVLGLAAAIFLVIAVVQSIQLNGFLWIDGTRDKLENCTRDNNELRAGVNEAKRLNEQQIQRIEREQQEISDEVSRNLTERLERLRSELRPKAAPRNPGSPKAGPDGQAPGTTPDPAEVCISSEQFLLGAEYEEKLQQWINWYERQQGVSRN